MVFTCVHIKIRVKHVEYIQYTINFSMGEISCTISLLLLWCVSMFSKKIIIRSKWLTSLWIPFLNEADIKELTCDEFLSRQEKMLWDGFVLLLYTDKIYVSAQLTILYGPDDVLVMWFYAIETNCVYYLVSALPYDVYEFLSYQLLPPVDKILRGKF